MAHCIRTVRLPVAEVRSGNKGDFYHDLRASLKLSTAVANRVLSLCMATDSEVFTPTPTGKLPSTPKLYTYPEVSMHFPGCANQCAAICRAFEKKYRQFRYGIATGQKSLPSERMTPWPLLHNKSSMTIRRLNSDSLSIQLLGEKWIIRLRGGSNYARQIRLLSTLGDEAIRDSSIWIDRRGVAVLGIAVQLPDKQRESSGTLLVSTARDALLVAVRDKDDIPFTINADHIKGWQAERNRRMQRLRQDRKAGAKRDYINEHMDIASRKYRQRLSSLCFETAAHVVKHAIRRRLGTIAFDGTIRSYCPDFPWAELRRRIMEVCEREGIAFEDKTLAIGDPDLSKPHVYFLFAPLVNQVKIGLTSRIGGERKIDIDNIGGLETVVLAIDNQPRTKLHSTEKRYHALFAEHRLVGEWFRAEPIIAWLQENKILGNAGNLAEIMQYLPVSSDAETPPSTAIESDTGLDAPLPFSGCGQTVGDISQSGTAPEVNCHLTTVD